MAYAKKATCSLAIASKRAVTDASLIPKKWLLYPGYVIREDCFQSCVDGGIDR